MVNRNISLSLLTLLLLSSSISFSEFSWQNWREWPQQFLKIEQDTLKKVMPFIIAGFATFGGLYYWINKTMNNMWNKPLEEPDSGAIPLFPLYVGKKTELPTVQEASSIKQIDQEEPLKKQTDNEKRSITQFEVYSQFNDNGGGDASCGYHSLLHSMQLVKDLGTGQETSTLKKNLMDSNVIQKYFGENGTWRKDIIEKRKKEEFKKELHKKLVASLKKGDTQDKKAVDLYKSSLGFMEDWIIVALSQTETSTLPHDFTDKAIRGYISKGLLNLKNENNADLVENLQQDKAIDAYFNYDEIRKNVLSENWAVELSVLWKTILADRRFESDFKGEWLSDGEVEYIWDHHKKDILEENIFPENVCKFKAIANFEFIGQEGFDEVTPYIKENIKPDLNHKKQLFGIFALGTMRQTGDRQGTRGHWYSLVMHQGWEGARKYYVMDSANNHDRTNDDNVSKIIKLIENEK